jgi:hypothetical protein
VRFLSHATVASYQQVIHALAKNNWASRLDPIGSVGLVLIDNHRTNYAVARDTTSI